MGVAASQRGSALIRRQCAANDRPVEFALMEELNAIPKYPDAGTPLGPLHFVAHRNVWFAECPKTGFGYWYPTLREAVRRWRVTIIGYEHGVWHAVPMPKETTP